MAGRGDATLGTGHYYFEEGRGVLCGGRHGAGVCCCCCGRRDVEDVGRCGRGGRLLLLLSLGACAGAVWTTWRFVAWRFLEDVARHIDLLGCFVELAVCDFDLCRRRRGSAEVCVREEEC